MDKKTILTIILALVLALISALLLFNKKDVEKNTDTVSQQEEIVSEEIELEQDLENANETILEEEQQEVLKSEKIVKPQYQQIQKTVVKPVVNSEAVSENVKIQEATIVEEATDYGIIKDEKTNTITVTREFRPSSKSKYLFKGYGQLVETTTK